MILNFEISHKSEITEVTQSSEGAINGITAGAFSCARHFENVTSCTMLKLSKRIYFRQKEKEYSARHQLDLSHVSDRITTSSTGREKFNQLTIQAYNADHCITVQVDYIG